MSKLILACVLLTGLAFKAQAQVADPSIDQIPAASRSIDVPMPSSEKGRSFAAPAQLASGAESGPATTQINPEGRSAPATDQLSRIGKTAQAPQPLSAPSEGRKSTVERVAGEDRCDPAAPKQPRSKCAKVIENRSAEFARPDPRTLSPEQRLLLEQEVREAGLDPVTGARRLAATGEAESLAAMGVAAVVLRDDEVPKKSKADEDPAKAAAEIVGAILNQPPRAPPQ